MVAQELEVTYDRVDDHDVRVRFAVEDSDSAWLSVRQEYALGLDQCR